MNEMFRALQPSNRMRKPHRWLAFVSMGCLFAVTFPGISGCTRNEPVQELSSPVPVETDPPRQVADATEEIDTSLPTEPDLLEGSGVMVWAEQFPKQLILGLDGDLYEPYGGTTIEGVQKALRHRGLYAGPMNGILDMPTMKSIYAFQEANQNLQRCGIPTPHTRKMLKQGSHTDLNS
jgi:hypothetical protein